MVMRLQLSEEVYLNKILLQCCTVAAPALYKRLHRGSSFLYCLSRAYMESSNSFHVQVSFRYFILLLKTREHRSTSRDEGSKAVHGFRKLGSISSQEKLLVE